MAHVERETGYAIVILWGGPQVKEDGVIGTWQYVTHSLRAFKWLSVENWLAWKAGQHQRAENSLPGIKIGSAML